MNDPIYVLAGIIHGSTCEDSPPECIEYEGVCVKAAKATTRALAPWTVALHSDGSGQPGLYHDCDPENAIDWLESDTLSSVLGTIANHVCEESR